jgi:oligopeptide/dipeptide ABC transporter ATP-binding protein
LKVHRQGARREREERAAELLRAVGLDAAYLDRFPHEFSGGQRQRIGIARALAVGARLILADEPVSALDVSVQVQILNLMKDLQRDLRLTTLFIAHDLAVVRYMCSRVLVMYLGRIVEAGSSERVYRRPLHPYTRALLAAVPDVDRSLRRGDRKRAAIQGDTMTSARPDRGCAFSPRCRFARDVCRAEDPVLRELHPGHQAACHFAESFE